MSKKRPFEWIDTVEGVRSLAAAIEKAPVVGIDTESDSFHRYQEQVCLVQMTTADHDYLLDTIAVRELSALAKPLADPGRESIFNGADYDIVCLKRDFGIHFGKIFDTALGAQLLGYPATGLSALLERHFGVKVSKQYQRDEWFRRPLKPEQIDYALNDVRYLLPLRERIRDELVAAKRLEWAEEEFALLIGREWTRESFRPEDFWRIRGSRDLTRRDQAILRELAIMRNERARSVNRPPFKVISDHALKELARAKPKSARGLRKIRGVSDLMIRRFGEEILAAIRRGTEVAEKALPVPPRGERKPGDPAVNRRLEALKAWRKEEAARHRLDPGVLAPLSTLRAIARKGPRTLKDLQGIPELTRWRIREFGEAWLQLLGGKS
jgi:ribonuclease D